MVEATKKKKERIDISESPHTPFSVSAYIDRMEKTYLDTLQERENEKPYEPVLWWGFDGLKLKADGTTEWISRRPKEEKSEHKSIVDLISPAPVPAYPATYPAWTNYRLYPQQYGFNQCMSIQAQTEMLRSQLQALNLQSAQCQINQEIINSIQR